MCCPVIKSFIVMGHAPDIATIARTLDARDLQEAKRRAEAMLFPEFPAHARRDVKIVVSEICR